MGEIVSPHFVGRADELGRLREALAAAANGRPGAVVIGGEGGVGKSRLVAEFLVHAREEGALVLTGGCIQCRDGGPPYWPFIDALRRFFHDATSESPLAPEIMAEAIRQFRPELARLLPDLGQDILDLTEAGPPAAAPAALPYAAVLGLLTRLSEHCPVVLVVEDLHWADRSTQDLLSFLLTNLGLSRTLIVATYRSEALVHGHSLSPLLAELRRSRRADLVDLPRFTRVELTAQLEAILAGRPPRELVENIWSRSEGNAFFAEELLAARASSGPKLPATLSQVLLARIDVLSDTARQVLRMTATGGQGVDHRLLASVAGVPAALPERDLLDALRECVAHQVLVADADGDSYQFRHSLLQEAVYDDLLPGERARFHAAYARALDAQAPVDDVTTAAKLAYHWERAGDHERALAAGLTAAAAAEALYGFAEAHQHLERALELWMLVTEAGRAGLDRLELYERAAESADMAGNHRRACVLIKAAIAELGGGVDSTRRALLQQRLGGYLWGSGDSEAALVAYEEAVERIAPASGTAEWACIVAAHAEALMRAGRYRESAHQAEAALGVARRLGARADEGHILATLGFDLAFLGNPTAGVALLDESLRVAAEIGNPNDVGRAYLNLAELLSGPLNQLADGASVAEAGVDHVRRLGLERSYGVSLQAIAINTLFRLGRWSDADVLLRQAMELNPAGAEAIELRLARARLSVGRGDFLMARSDLDEATRMCERATDPRHQAPLLTLTAGLALWEGQLGVARDAVARGLEQASHSEDTWVVAPLVWHGLRAEGDTAELARARRRPSEIARARSAGQALLAQVSSLVERSVDAATPVRQAVAAYALMCKAEFARLDDASSPEAWGQAADIWEGLGQPYPVAYARWREGEALLATSARSSRAAVALREAYEVALRLAAAPLSRQIELLAERARIQLNGPDEPGAPSHESAALEPEVPAALAALTKREREVLLLVAEGRTNRQIAGTLYISEKTASLHVSHILAKLAVTSRVQAGAVVHRLGLVVPR